MESGKIENEYNNITFAELCKLLNLNEEKPLYRPSVKTIKRHLKKLAPIVGGEKNAFELLALLHGNKIEFLKVCLGELPFSGADMPENPFNTPIDKLIREYIKHSHALRN